MQVTEKNEGRRYSRTLHKTWRPLVVLGLLQVGRGLLCVVFQVRSNSRGPPRPPGGPDISVFLDLRPLAIGILDLLLAIFVLMQYRYALYPEFLLDIALCFVFVWFPIGPLFVWDIALSYLGIGISLLSIIHLVIMFWWWKPEAAT
jgi:hypothetical protein